MTIEYYLHDTEPAVKAILSTLNMYNAMTPPPSLAKYSDEDGVIRLSRDQAKEYLQAVSESLGLESAKAVLAGSIIQVAYTGIKEYSKNRVISDTANQLGVSERSAALPFAIGREVHGIPIGLLIYAVRIHYNHWEEGKLSNSVANAVFQKLQYAYMDSPTFDLGYVFD